MEICLLLRCATCVKFSVYQLKKKKGEHTYLHNIWNILVCEWNIHRIILNDKEVYIRIFCKENSDIHQLISKYVGDYNIENNVTRHCCLLFLDHLKHPRVEPKHCNF